MSDQATEARLKQLDDAKREICAEFRRRLSDLLKEEEAALGLVPLDHHEIEIYY